jgi:hypothetical protein
MAKPRKLRSKLLRAAIVAVLASLSVFWLICGAHVRSLWSLERVPGTNMYVMDYDGGFGVDTVRREGLDPRDVEGSLIRAFFPCWLVPIANWVGGHRPGQRSWETSLHSC